MGKRAHFGVFLNIQHSRATKLEAEISEHYRQAEVAASVGFESIWVGQHYLSDYQEVQPIAFLASLSRHFPRVKLGTAVLILPLLHPVSVAEELASLDILSGGRLIAGFGLGYRAPEFSSFGIDPSAAVGRFSEGIQVIKELWKGTTISYRGLHFQLDDVLASCRPLQQPRPPIWIGANSEAGVKRAAQLGDAWLMSPISSLTILKTQLEKFLNYLRVYGAPEAPAVPLMREVYIGASEKHAWDEVRPFLQSKYAQYVGWGQQDAMSGSERLDLPFEELAKDRFLIGDPIHVRDEIDRYRELLGVTHFIFRIQWPGLPAEAATSTLRLLGDRVLGDGG